MVKSKRNIILTFCMMMFCALMMVACGGKIYTMTFRVDDKLYSSVGKYQEGDTILLPRNPEKEGYTFSRWSIDIPKNMPAKDLVAYARFSPNKYSVTFNYNGATEGVTLSYLDVTYDSPVGDLPSPQKQGYKFSGWFDSDNNKYVSDTLYKKTSDITLKAKFEANDVTVKFFADEKLLTPLTTKVVKYGQELTDIPKAPSKKGYSVRWSLDSFESITSSVNVYPIYTANKYSISFNAVDGTTFDDKEVYFDAVIGSLPEPTKANQYFIGWYYSETLFSADKLYLVDSNVTLTAKFSDSKTTVSFYTDDTMTTLYTVRHLEAGKTSVEDIPMCPLKTGHTATWHKTLDNITSNTKVYAVYTPIDYTITYMIGDVVYTTKTYHYDDTISHPSVEDSDDYIFVEWDTDFEKMPDSNIKIYAKVIYFNLDMSKCADGETITISKGGEFTLSGKTTANIVIDTDENITLKLNGVEYKGDKTFISSIKQSEVSVISMLGTANHIVSNKGSGFDIKNKITFSGAGNTFVDSRLFGIKAKSLELSASNLSIECYGTGILVDSLSVSGGKTTLLSYNDTEIYDYIEDSTGKYVLVDNKYIIDDGTHSEKTHYTVVLPYGVVSNVSVVSAGELNITSVNYIGMSSDTIEIANGSVSVDTGSFGIRATSITMSSGALYVNHSVENAINVTTFNVTGGNIVINTGLCGIKAISVSLKDMTLSISSECDGIVAEDVTIDNSTCTITTTGSFARDDSNGIFKYDNGKYSRFLKSDLGKIAQKYKLVSSAKGISVKNNLTILSGDIDISSVDVALYSEDMLYIFGGNINIISECQGIESDIIIQIGYKDALELTPNFTINIASSYIGLKASYIECYDGITMAYSYSDGVSIIKSPSDNNYLFIENQARVYVSSEEDGVDVVGDITLNGGSLIIYAGNTNESMAVRYTKNFYYLKGELLNIGFASMLPTKQLSSAKLVGFSLDSASSSKCARNTYLMLYETPAVAPASAEENVFSKVMYLGVRNYIKGMTIIYGMDDMVIGSTYSLRYASGEYAGGTTPTHLPFICEGGNYNINRCYTITGVALDEGVTSVLFGKHINVLGDIEGTIINKFKTLTESVENADYTLTSIDKGAVVKNETPAPSPDGNEE